MATLAYNEILTKRVIVLNNEPYVVVSAHVFRKQQRKPVNQTKLRSLKTGRVVEQTFHQNETAIEADVTTREVEFIYSKEGRLPAGRQEYWFCEPGNPGSRFQIAGDIIGEQGRFLKPKSTVEAMVFEDEIIGITLPIKVDLTVKEAPPAVKGNTAQGGTKEVVLETGAHIQAPLFINEGDVVRINTETGFYSERMEKA